MGAPGVSAWRFRIRSSPRRFATPVSESENATPSSTSARLRTRSNASSVAANSDSAVSVSRWTT